MTIRSRLLLTLALSASLVLSGCGLGQAAQVMKTFRISLAAFQDAEIAASQKGFITPSQHNHDQADVEKLAVIGASADRAIQAGDKAGVILDVQAGLAAVAEIEANDVTGITDATTRAEVEATIGALQNLLSQVGIQLGVKQ